MFGCSHEKTTFPITLKRAESSPNHLGSTYMVCLDCGKELPYSWSEMKIVRKTWFSIFSTTHRASQQIGLSAGELPLSARAHLRT